MASGCRISAKMQSRASRHLVCCWNAGSVFASIPKTGLRPAAALCKPARTERRQQGMRLSGDDLARQQFTRNEAQRCSAMAEGHVVTRNSLELPKDRLSIAWDRLRSDSVGIKCE